MGARDLTPERIVRLEDDAVVLLDQRRLPDEEVDIRCASAAEVAEAIRTLAIRGAPAIGVAELSDNTGTDGTFPSFALEEHVKRYEIHA